MLRNRWKLRDDWSLVTITVATATLILILSVPLLSEEATAGGQPQACEGLNLKFQKDDDGVLKFKCTVNRSAWILFTGSSTGDGYRVKWTARTDDYPYTGVIAAGARFYSAVVPDKAPMATASMAKDPSWQLEIVAEPKGSPDSTLTLVLHLGTKEDGKRKARISS